MPYTHTRVLAERLNDKAVVESLTRLEPVTEQMLNLAGLKLHLQHADSLPEEHPDPVLQEIKNMPYEQRKNKVDTLEIDFKAVRDQAVEYAAQVYRLLDNKVTRILSLSGVSRIFRART